MIKRFNEHSINEAYKKATDYKVVNGFNVPVHTYVDHVFDHLVEIVCDVNDVSEKSFTDRTNTRNYIEMYFDNNQDVLLDIDTYSNIKGRYQLCAEHLFNKHFQNDSGILEKINSTDYRSIGGK